MNLFEKLPDNFFSILSSKNKNIYGEALITLYDALTMYRSRIRKNDYLDLLKSRSGDDFCKLTFDDEDELAFENLEPSLANKANFILKRLIETGWVYIDYDAKSNVEYLLLPSYSINMLKLIYQFADDSSTHYVSYVHTTYSDLKMEDDLQDESMYRALENAYNNTLSLEIEVTKLDHSIKVFKRQLNDMFEPNEVLKQHFDICREDVVDPIYHPLKTHDSITLYHGPISNILKKWLSNDAVREKIVEQCLRENHSVRNHQEAEQDVVRKINRIQDIYYRLSNDINEIDKSQAEYVKASAEKVIFLNNHDKTIKGKLEKIISVLARNIADPNNKDCPNIMKNVVQSIKLYQQGYIDSDSITKPYKRQARIFSEPIPIDDFGHTFDENTINVLIGENSKYSDENVMEFMSNNFGDKEQITAEDVKLRQVEDFIFLILASIKSTSRVSFYDLSREDKLDISIEKDNKYIVPNFIYTKKKGE